MTRLPHAAAVLSAVLWHGPLLAQDAPLMTEGARYTMSHEPPVSLRAPGFDWDHQLTVALPATYGVLPEKSYPVLWLTDGPGMMPLAVGILSLLVMGNLVPGKDHFTVVADILGEGILALWGDEVEAPGSALDDVDREDISPEQ